MEPRTKPPLSVRTSEVSCTSHELPRLKPIPAAELLQTDQVCCNFRGSKHINHSNRLAAAPRNVLTKAENVTGLGTVPRKHHLRAGPDRSAKV